MRKLSHLALKSAAKPFLKVAPTRTTLPTRAAQVHFQMFVMLEGMAEQL